MSIGQVSTAKRRRAGVGALKCARVSILCDEVSMKTDGQMDRGSKQSWSWLPQQMPGVAQLIAQRRTTDGAEWVNTCWRRGVIEGQPGWFFAADGSLTVGTPIDPQPLLAYHEARKISPTAVLLDMRKREGEAGHVA